MKEEMGNEENKGYILTNKSCLEKKPILTENDQDKKALQFLYQITNQNFPTSQFKKDLNSFIENGKSFFGFNPPSISSLSKGLEKNKGTDSLIFKNKMISYKNNLYSFQKRMKFMRENNQKFNEILECIKNLTQFDFFLGEDFDIKENDPIIDFDKIVLYHRYIKNFEDLINIKNKIFKISYLPNKYKLTSEFYEYYQNKYSLIFSLRIKTNRIYIDFSNSRFEEIIKYFLKENKECEYLKDIEDDVITMMSFYLKYLLYKFMKEEIKALRKNLMDSKDSSFEYKGLTFSYEKTLGKISIICSYFDNLEIIFSIIKSNKESKETNYVNNKNDSKIIIEYFRIFCRNIYNDVKYSNIINNFIIRVKKNQNLSLDNITKSSIFIKNISKLGFAILKQELNKIIQKELKKSNIIYSEYISAHRYFGKYQLYFEFMDKGNKVNYCIHLYFDNNLNLTIDIKEPYLNHIYVLDNNKRYSVEKGKINFYSLFRIIKNMVPTLINNDYQGISIKILSI